MPLDLQQNLGRYAHHNESFFPLLPRLVERVIKIILLLNFFWLLHDCPFLSQIRLYSSYNGKTCSIAENFRWVVNMQITRNKLYRLILGGFHDVSFISFVFMCWPQNLINQLIIYFFATADVA